MFSGIIFFACILRFLHLGSIPAGFHADEADYGYNAYSILKTGKDEYGKHFPLIYRSFGDYKGAVYAYLTIPFIVARGLTEWAVRAPSAVFGVLFVVLTYAFVYQISASYRLALLSMALAAISPFGILLSRVQSDPLVGAFFFYLGFYLFLLWTGKKRLWYLGASVVSLYLGFFTYSNDQLFVLPFFILVAVCNWSTWSKRIRTTTGILFIVILVTIGGIVVTRAGTRLGQVSIFSTENVQMPLDESLREDGAMRMPMLASRVLHNKVLAYGQYFIDTFASYFSYDFLFRQASQPVREKIPGSGVLLLIDLPFLLFGIYTMFHKRYPYARFILLWLFMVPAGLSFVSGETPNIHRFIWAAIPIYLLVGIGIVAGLDAMKKHHAVYYGVGVILLYLAFECLYLEHLFVHQPIHSPVYRNGADKELALVLKDYVHSYDIIVSQKVLEHMLFFWPVEPSVYQQEGSPRDTDNAWYRNIFFAADACPSLRLTPAVASLTAPRILYVDRAECHLAKDDTLVKVISFKNTLPAYYLVEKQ